MGYSGPDPKSPNGPYELKLTLGDTYDPNLITLWWFGHLLAWLAYKTISLSKVWQSIWTGHLARFLASSKVFNLEHNRAVLSLFKLF
jgi:hypothetical protein